VIPCTVNHTVDIQFCTMGARLGVLLSYDLWKRKLDCRSSNTGPVTLLHSFTAGVVSLLE
jgi:hypothetical protein